MRKLVLVLICTVIMSIFIGFNYLLWDKENREMDIQYLRDSNEYNSATINALNREIKKLDDEKNGLNTKINELEFDNRILNVNNQNLTQENTKFSEALNEKNDVIAGLKKNVDLSVLEQTIRIWVESINSGDYQTAYGLLHNKYISKHDNISGIFRFTNLMKSSVKSMELKSVKLYEYEISEDDRGNIVFDATIEVVMTDGNVSANINFKEGSNRCFFTIIYNEPDEEWVIGNLIII